MKSGPNRARGTWKERERLNTVAIVNYFRLSLQVLSPQTWPKVPGQEQYTSFGGSSKVSLSFHLGLVPFWKVTISVFP